MPARSVPEERKADLSTPYNVDDWPADPLAAIDSDLNANADIKEGASLDGRALDADIHAQPNAEGTTRCEAQKQRWNEASLCRDTKQPPASFENASVDLTLRLHCGVQLGRKSRDNQLFLQAKSHIEEDVHTNASKQFDAQTNVRHTVYTELQLVIGDVESPQLEAALQTVLVLLFVVCLGLLQRATAPDLQS